MVDSSAQRRDRCRPCKGLAGGDAKDELAEKEPVEELGSRACPQRVVSWSQGMGKNLQRYSVKNSTYTWKPRPQYVAAIRVKHSHCREALFTHHEQGCGAKMG